MLTIHDEKVKVNRNMFICAIVALDKVRDIYVVL